MAFQKPNENLIKTALPEISELCFIASGGFKGVYRTRINKTVEALKLIMIPEALSTDDEAVIERDELVARVKREIQILRKCQSPTIVKLGSLQPAIVKIDGKEFIAYSEEFLEGDNLWILLRNPKNALPPEAELKALTATLLTAIKELWEHRIIHRDIKPCNIIKTPSAYRQFVLLDLGIAFSRVDTPLTHSGIPATYRYFAPEMANPAFREYLDYRADLYTAALTIYEYAAKKHPLAKDFEDPMMTVTRAVKDIPPSLKTFRSDLSEDFCDLIDTMLNKVPALRPGNIQMLMKRTGGTI